MAAERMDAGTFAETAAAVTSVLDDLGSAANRVHDVYLVAMQTLDAVGQEMGRRGQPTPHSSPREQMEWNMFAQWGQLLTEMCNKYLAVTMQQGAQLAGLSKGPQVVDPRSDHQTRSAKVTRLR